MEKIEEKKETFWSKWGWLLPLTVIFAFLSVSVIANAWQNASQKDYESHLSPAERVQLVDQRTADAKANTEGWAIFYGNVANLLWNPATAWMVVWLLVILRMMNRRWI
jgi:hypothetical protein